MILAGAVGKLVDLIRKKPSLGNVLLYAVIVPGLVLIMLFQVFAPKPTFRIALRFEFILILSVIPAVLYYLFHASRKHSLLSEFISNLARFGLLEKVTPEAHELCRSQRIITYVREFDSLYGPLSLTQLDLLSRRTNVALDDLLPVEREADAEQQGTGGASMKAKRESHAPVLLTTILMALGWFFVLPPMPESEALERFGASPFERAGNRKITEGTPSTDEASRTAGPGSVSPTPGSTPDSAGQIPGTTKAGGAEGDGEVSAYVLEPVQNPVTFAFLGAYFFSLQVLFWRFLRRDLSSRAYVGVLMRLILALVGVWVVIAVMRQAGIPESQRRDLAVAFAIGVMPVVVLQFFEGLFKKFPLFPWIMPTLETKRPLNELDGLTIWHETRLKEEDIESVANMAMADPAELMIRTRFAPDRIVDWIDQAILSMHLPPTSKKAKQAAKPGAGQPDGNGPDGNASSGAGLRDTLQALNVRSASGFLALSEATTNDQQAKQFTWSQAADQTAWLFALVTNIENHPHIHMIRKWKGGVAATPPGPSSGAVTKPRRSRPDQAT